MTSSILPPRSALAPCSPRTHAIASTTLDLPEPLGPTTEVMPGSSFNVVADAKDLKPLTVKLLRCTDLQGSGCTAVLGGEYLGVGTHPRSNAHPGESRCTVLRVHKHKHGVTAAGRHRRRLAAVLAITVAVLVAEVVGAVLSGSLALLADAGHLAGDAVGIGLALFAVWMGGRPTTPQRTFGYQRAEIIAALVNGLLLLGLAGYVGYQAVLRLIQPEPVGTTIMVVVGLVAAVGNGLAVLVAAGVLALTGFTRADAIASLAIAALIVPRTLHLLRDAVDVLLEATPRGVDLEEVRRHLLDAPGVRDVHDLHAWMITSGVPVVSAHVVVEDAILADGGYGRLLDQLLDCLAGHFDVDHSTLQLEPAGHVDHERAHHI